VDHGDGGRSLTFRLRPGLKFSDGTPLTAADVARTLAIVLDPQQASPPGDSFRSERATRRCMWIRLFR